MVCDGHSTRGGERMRFFARKRGDANNETVDRLFVVFPITAASE